MFESVGKNREPNRRRQLTALGLSLTFNVALLGAATALLSLSAEGGEEPEELPTRITLYTPASAPLPESPASRAAGATAPRSRSAPAPSPPIATAAPPPTSEEPPQTDERADEATDQGADAAAATSPGDSRSGGRDGGGDREGDGSSAGGGPPGASGSHSVHWSQVKARRRVPPKMPAAAKVLNFDEERCRLRFFIDERGRPYDIRIAACPTIFHASALEAAWRWRFYPYRIDGEARKAQFDLVIRYRLTGR